jgi:hypothetical protein
MHDIEHECGLGYSQTRVSLLELRRTPCSLGLIENDEVFMGRPVGMRYPVLLDEHVYVLNKVFSLADRWPTPSPPRRSISDQCFPQHLDQRAIAREERGWRIWAVPHAGIMDGGQASEGLT